MDFYVSNNPTNSVKALKEVVVLRIDFNPTRSTSPCYNTTHACNIQSYRKLCGGGRVDRLCIVLFGGFESIVRQ